MRIKFEFEQVPTHTPKHLAEKITWIEDFPCRLHEGDMVRLEILQLRSEFDSEPEDYDDPIVRCYAFDRDENGIYQHVWLDF